MVRTEIGFHASHEQFPPDELRELCQLAESQGFEAVLASDHFHPWSEQQGESGHVWAWLGAAMEATDLPFGTVNAPGYRYHPAIIAQAAATLGVMYPDRFWFAAGSGQLLNEGVAGMEWPPKEDRNARLRECGAIMKDLWNGETVTWDGHVTVQEATLYTRPESPPPLFGAALSTETARWLGGWADGMITLATPDHEDDRERVEAFRAEAPDKPVYLKAQLSYADDSEAALEGALEQWRTNCVPGPVTQQLRTPEDFDELGAHIEPGTVEENVRVAADLEDHREWIERDCELNVERIFLHNVNTNQEQFLDAFGEEVLPAIEHKES